MRQCSRVLDRPGAPNAASVDYDGVNLLSLRDREAAADIWNDEETLRIMRPDEPRVFSTYVREFTLVAREQVLVDGAETEVCLVLFLRAVPGCALSPKDFDASPGSPWQDARRLVLNTVAGHGPPGYEYDAIVEAWSVSIDAVAAAFGDPSVWDADLASRLAFSKAIREIRRAAGFQDDPRELDGMVEFLAALFEGLTLRIIGNPALEPDLLVSSAQRIVEQALFRSGAMTADGPM